MGVRQPSKPADPMATGSSAGTRPSPDLMARQRRSTPMGRTATGSLPGTRPSPGLMGKQPPSKPQVRIATIKIKNNEIYYARPLASAGRACIAQPSAERGIRRLPAFCQIDGSPVAGSSILVAGSTGLGAVMQSNQNGEFAMALPCERIPELSGDVRHCAGSSGPVALFLSSPANRPAYSDDGRIGNSPRRATVGGEAPGCFGADDTSGLVYPEALVSKSMSYNSDLGLPLGKKASVSNGGRKSIALERSAWKSVLVGCPRMGATTTVQ